MHNTPERMQYELRFVMAFMCRSLGKILFSGRQSKWQAFLKGPDSCPQKYIEPDKVTLMISRVVFHWAQNEVCLSKSCVAKCPGTRTPGRVARDSRSRTQVVSREWAGWADHTQYFPIAGEQWSAGPS